MKTNLTIVCAVLLVLQSTMFGQKTEVKVNEGLVRVQTDTGEQFVHPGQIASLELGKNPDVKIDDPIVDDAIELYNIAKAERANSDVGYSLVSIQSYAIENNGKAHGAFATEFTNYRKYDMNLCLLGETFMPKEKKYYSMDGKLLDFEQDTIAPNLGFYYLHYPTMVKPGDAFEFVATFEMDAALRALKNSQGHYEYNAGEGTPNSLAYYRIILPEGAEYLECTGNIDVVKIDSHYGRVGLTIKGHKSNNGSHYKVVFDLADEYLEEPEEDALNYNDMRKLMEDFQAEIQNVMTESDGDILKVYDYVVQHDYKWVKAMAELNKQLLAKGYYTEAMDVCSRIEKGMNCKENPYALEAIIWQGHLLDMQGERDEALVKYNEALGIYPRYGRGATRHDQWGIVLNEEWVRERLETPFTKEMMQPKF